MFKKVIRKMEITTARLCLRPMDMSRLHSTHVYASDAENTRYMMYLPFESLEETARFIREAEEQWRRPQPDYLEFVILKDGVHIGGITLYFLTDRTQAELGWVLNSAYQRRGYVTEAAAALIGHVRPKWGINRVIACCDSENISSRRVMEKLGMRFAHTGTRSNRSMPGEERIELTYEIFL